MTEPDDGRAVLDAGLDGEPETVETLGPRVAQAPAAEPAQAAAPGPTEEDRRVVADIARKALSAYPDYLAAKTGDPSLALGPRELETGTALTVRAVDLWFPEIATYSKAVVTIALAAWVLGTMLPRARRAREIVKRKKRSPDEGDEAGGERDAADADEAEGEAPDADRDPLDAGE